MNFAGKQLKLLKLDPSDTKLQDEIAYYLFGVAARRRGEPMDELMNPSWQRGWADANQ
jgi:hypothetical protein